MIHPDAVCDKHGFSLVSMPRDPEEPHYDLAGAVILGSRDNKGFSYKCPLANCASGIPLVDGV